MKCHDVIYFYNDDGDIMYNIITKVWITAVRQGLKAGVYFWPGSEVEFNGKLNGILYFVIVEL